ISSVPDGAEALDFLHRKGKYTQAHRPDLVILDLNLPRKHGREVLAELKADPALKSTPVVIFSTSRAHRDVNGTFELGANSYVSKPGNLQEFMVTVTSIADYWFGCAQLPARRDDE